MPGVLKDLRILFEDAPPQSQHLARSWEIHDRAKKIYRALHDSHVLYQHRPPYPTSLFDLPVSAEGPDRVRLRIFLLYVTMYTRRVQATLSASEIERATSEVEAQTYATQTLLIEKAAAALNPSMAWHLEQRNSLPHSILETREEWFVDKSRGMSWEESRDFLAQRWLSWEDTWRARVLACELDETKDGD
jgi:hypothetical protein